MKRNENEIDKRNEPIRMNMGWWIMKMAAFAITVRGLLGGGSWRHYWPCWRLLR